MCKLLNELFSIEHKKLLPSQFPKAYRFCCLSGFLRVAYLISNFSDLGHRYMKQFNDAASVAITITEWLLMQEYTYRLLNKSGSYRKFNTLLHFLFLPRGMKLGSY